MSIDQIDTIDIISTTPDGKVMLTISDHLTWDETCHLQLLEGKINMYLHFIESGQIHENYPDAIGRGLIIAVTMKFEPDAIGSPFLEMAKETINQSGVEFQFKVLRPTE
jgi:hypothetical protein